MSSMLFEIPELILHIISLLDPTTGDYIPTLRCCALVSRFWTFAAQAQLFHSIQLSASSFDTKANERWVRLVGVLSDSPHLVSCIRELDCVSEQLSATTLRNICAQARGFTNLTFLGLASTNIDSISTRAVRELLSASPGLRGFDIAGTFTDTADLVEILRQLPLGVKHIEISCRLVGLQHVAENVAELNRVAPKHLRLVELSQIDHWLQGFDLSRLEMLSLSWYARVSSWPAFIPSLQNLRVLDIRAETHLLHAQLNLADLPNLSTLQFCIPRFSETLPHDALITVVAILSTLLVPASTTSPLRIILAFEQLRCELVQRHAWTELDNMLCRLAYNMLRETRLDIATVAWRYEQLPERLPMTACNGLLHRVDPWNPYENRRSWWKLTEPATAVSQLPSESQMPTKSTLGGKRVKRRKTTCIIC
ncbi:hypothetical protein C8F01DRAFT_1146192 [Mycena amicta]|nr:hypothetical protein C8F01DRAFT_1146192 [Mycena amicta]